MLLTRAPRGTADVLPGEVRFWHHIRTAAQRITQIYGYEEIITPVIEHTELFTRTTGESSDIVTREMYTFQDRSERSLTLRPEGTPGVGRAYLEHQMDALPQPTKLYYFGPMFRYERPQAGRQREFSQFGVEVFGAESFMADAEVIMLAMRFLESLGLSGLEVHLNTIGCSKCRPVYRERLVAYLNSREGLCEDCQRRLAVNPLRVLDCKNERCREIAAAAPVTGDNVCPDCQEHFDGVKRLLAQRGIPFDLDPKLVRGLDYYSRTVFEFISSSLGAQNAVFGGGRYDGLIESLGGKPTPGVGWALGIERLIMVLQKAGIGPPSLGLTAAYVVTAPETKMLGFEITEKLRAAGIRAEVDLLERSFKAQMKQADRIGATYAVFVGQDEVAKGRATVRNMKTREQFDVAFEDIAPCIKRADLG